MSLYKIKNKDGIAVIADSFSVASGSTTAFTVNSGVASFSNGLNITGSLLVNGSAPGGSTSGGAISGSILIELYNGGTDLTTGIKDTPVYLPYGGTVTGWEIMAYNASNTLITTSCVIDVLSDTFANLPLAGTDSIAGTEKPTLSSQSTTSNNTITTWSTLTAGNYIQAEIESINTGVAKVVVAIKVTKS